MFRIPLIKPYLTPAIKARVAAVLDSGFLTEGPVAHELEAAFRRATGAAHAIACCNCTVGLEMGLRAMGIGPGDEVLVPDYTYPATASAVAIVGARAVLVDVDPDTMLMDLDAAERAITPRTRAMIPVSLFGSPLDHGRLRQLQSRYGLLLLEDAACALGAAFQGRPVGHWADITVFSLHPRKFITTGEGGLITTDNPAWAAWMESYKHFGMDPGATREGTTFARIGTNYKMSDILAAVGLGQMAELDALLGRRQELAAAYRELLRAEPAVRWPGIVPGGSHSYQSCCVFVPERNRVLAELRAQGIEVQIGTYALHLHPAYQESGSCHRAGPLENSRKVFDTCLALPLYHDLTAAGQGEVAGALLRALRS